MAITKGQISFRAIRNQWYKQGTEDGIVDILRNIAETKGINLDGVAKRWEHENFRIDVILRHIIVRSDKRFLVRCEYNTKKKFIACYEDRLFGSQKGTSKLFVKNEHSLFVKGDWLTKLVPFVSEEYAEYFNTKVVQYTLERQQLIERLNLVDANAWSLSQHQTFMGRHPLAYKLGLIEFPVDKNDKP